MKLIHCADVHLGSKMEATLPKSIADARKGEVRATFRRMISYATAQGISLILLSGDVFDSDRPFKRDKEFFYDAVKNNPEITFLYLRGNHDSRESYTEEGLPNLKTFPAEWQGYTFGNVTVWGLEMNPENATSFYSTLKTDPDAVNIVMLHGQVSSSAGPDKIVLNRLAEKGIDYLALGHVHSYTQGTLDARGIWAYSGCPEGRGFDETGEKGFAVYDTEEKTVTFVPFSKRVILERTADIGDAETVYQATEIARGALRCTPDDIVRLTLAGHAKFDTRGLARDIETYLAGECAYLSVKDRTRRAYRIEDYAGDVSLRGEFIRVVLASDRYTEEEKQKILATGLRALVDGEVDA